MSNLVNIYDLSDQYSDQYDQYADQYEQYSHQMLESAVSSASILAESVAVPPVTIMAQI